MNMDEEKRNESAEVDESPDLAGPDAINIQNDEEYLNTALFASLARNLLDEKRSGRPAIPREVVEQKQAESRTEDSVIASLHEMRRRNKLKTEKDAFQAIARRELFDHLSDSRKKQYFYLSILLKKLIDLLQEEKYYFESFTSDVDQSEKAHDRTLAPREILLFIQHIQNLLAELQNGRTKLEIEDKSVKTLMRLIASLKGALIRCKYLGKRLTKLNLKTFIEKKIGMQVIEDTERICEVLRLNDAQKEDLAAYAELLTAMIETGDGVESDKYVAVEDLEKLVSGYSNIPAFRHTLPIGVNEGMLGVQELPDRLEIAQVMLRQMYELESSHALLKLNAIIGVLNNLEGQAHILVSSHDLLAEKINKAFFNLIPSEVPQDIQKRLRSIMFRMLKVLSYIEYIDSAYKQKDAEARPGYLKIALPFYAQIFQELKEILKDVTSEDSGFDGGNLDNEDEDLDLEFNIQLESQPPPSIEKQIQAIVTSLGQNEDESRHTPQKNVAGFYLRIQECLFVIEQGVDNALKDAQRDLGLAKNHSAGNYLGPEIEACNGYIKKALQMGILHLAQLFKENISMVDIFPEMKEEIQTSHMLRSVFLDFRKELAMINRQFQRLLEGGRNEVGLRGILLGLYRRMHNLSDQKYLLRFTEFEVWQDMEKHLEEYLRNNTDHTAVQYSAMVDHIKDFLNAFDKFPLDLNNRNVLQESDSKKLQNACEALRTARDLLKSVEISEFELQEALKYLSLVLEEIKKCKDRDREGLEYAIDQLFVILNYYHSKYRQIKEDSVLHESMIDELGMIERYLEGLFSGL